MKRLFLLSAFALVAICSSAYGSSLIGTPTKPEIPERQGWWEDFPLYGDVESVVMTEYKLKKKFGKVVRGGIRGCQKYYFNDAGDVIEYARYKSNGSLDYKWIDKYYSSGRRIESARYNSACFLFFEFIPKYDSSGNMIEEECYLYDLLFWKFIYKYDSSGNMIEKAMYRSDGWLVNKYIYKYDSRGNMIEATEYRGEALIPKLLTVYEITYRN